MTQEIEQVEVELVSVTPCADCGAFGWCDCALKPAVSAPSDSLTAFVSGLRKLAAFWESHPELQHPQFPGEFTVFGIPKEELPKYAKAFGSLEKRYSDSAFELKKDFGGGIVTGTYHSRDAICERVEVGEEVVPEHVIPAREETVVPEHKIKKYEWKCPDSLLKPSEAAVVSSSDDTDMPF